MRWSTITAVAALLLAALLAANPQRALAEASVEGGKDAVHAEIKALFAEATKLSNSWETCFAFASKIVEIERYTSGTFVRSRTKSALAVGEVAELVKFAQRHADILKPLDCPAGSGVRVDYRAFAQFHTAMGIRMENWLKAGRVLVEKGLCDALESYLKRGADRYDAAYFREEARRAGIMLPEAYFFGFARAFTKHYVYLRFLDCPPPADVKKQPLQSLQKGPPKSTPPAVNTPGLVINTGLDGSQWCTYGSGIGFPTFAPPTDDTGTPLFPGGPFINQPPTWPVPLTVSPPWGGDVTITDLPKGPTIVETPFGPPQIVSPPPPPGATPPPETPSAGPPSMPPSGKPPETPTAGPPSQPPTGKPPETPTAGPPSTPPVDKPPVRIVFPPPGAPPEIPIIIFVKATQSVLEGQPEVALPGHNTAVFPPFKPDLPFTDGGTQTAQQDVGFDKDPVKCTTGQGGECKLELDVGTQQEFGIRPTGGTASNVKQTWGGNFRLDLSVPKTSGGVLEFTGLPTDDVAKIDSPIFTQKISELRSGLPDQVNILPEPFRIGDRAFLRLGFDQPFGVTFDPAAHFAKLSSIGGRPVIYVIDYCRDKQPGPPLGAQPASFSSMNQALPEATVKLQMSILDRLRRPQ